MQLQDGTTALVPVRLQVIRAEFGTPSFQTYSNYHAAYAQDTWRFDKYITGLFGLRWETETMFGSVLNGTQTHYALTDNWAPRLGVTVDPMGKGKTKAYYNFGRFFEYLPLDLAERSLSSEQDWLGGLYLPDFTVNGAGQKIATINQFGTVNPIRELADLAHACGALIAVDACQSVPHMPVSVRELDVDFLAFSGHKACGPMGGGVLWARPELLERMPPFLGGGSMILRVDLERSSWNQVPHKFEAGTPDVASVAGLAAACDYLDAVGAAARRLEEALGDTDSPFARAMASAWGSVESLTQQVESAYKRELR